MKENVPQRGSPRNSSFELMRILSMLMIVAHHFALHIDLHNNTPVAWLPRIWLLLIQSFGKVGVNGFVLISGYFLSANAHAALSVRRIFKLLGQLIFYSAAIYLAACAAGLCAFRPAALIKSFFPITFETWWFASTYFVLYLLHPFINRLIHAIDRRTYRNLIAMLILIWSVLPVVTLHDFQGNSLLWFVTLYLATGYIRIHGSTLRVHSARRYALYFVLVSLLRFGFTLVFFNLMPLFPIFERYVMAINADNSLLTFLISLSMFMFFKTTKIKSSRIVNTIASACFGVYLIHDHFIVRDLIWQRVFKGTAYQNSTRIIPYSIFAVAAVFIPCVIIDLARQRLLERPYMRLVDRHSASWLKPFQAIGRTAQKRLFGNSADSK